jgi:hypothetical protein
MEVMVAAARALVIGLLAATAAVPAQERPLPDVDAFLAEVRKHLQTDQSRQSSYAYVETRREQSFDSDGRPVRESVKVVESYPGLPGEGRWERLISEDGRPVPTTELEKRDAERRKKAEDYARRMASRPQEESARQARELDKARRDTSSAVDDIFRVFDVRMVGREAVEGHEAIVFTLTPKPSPQPRTREGRLMRRFRVQAWISESDYELVKLDAEAVETVSFGFGLLARIHKGARFSFERRKVNDDVWLPAASRYSGSARVGLVKTIRRGGSSAYSNYRKFTVDTSTRYASPR